WSIYFWIDTSVVPTALNRYFDPNPGLRPGLFSRRPYWAPKERRESKSPPYGASAWADYGAQAAIRRGGHYGSRATRPLLKKTLCLRVFVVVVAFVGVRINARVTGRFRLIRLQFRTRFGARSIVRQAAKSSKTWHSFAAFLCRVDDTAVLLMLDERRRFIFGLKFGRHA